MSGSAATKSNQPLNVHRPLRWTERSDFRRGPIIKAKCLLSLLDTALKLGPNLVELRLFLGRLDRSICIHLGAQQGGRDYTV